MKVHLHRPAVAACQEVVPADGVWVLDIDLSEAQADGRTCLRCDQRAGRAEATGGMVPVGHVERPDGTCQVFAHRECPETRP